MLWNVENGKTNGITNWSKVCERYNSNKLEWIHIIIFKLVWINPLGGFQTLATNGLNPSVFSSNLLLASQELFSNNYKNLSGIDICSNSQKFVAKYLFKYS